MVHKNKDNGYKHLIEMMCLALWLRPLDLHIDLDTNSVSPGEILVSRVIMVAVKLGRPRTGRPDVRNSSCLGDGVAKEN